LEHEAALLALASNAIHVARSVEGKSNPSRVLA
jgi:hypothetical protein